VQIDVRYPDRDTERDILLATTGVTEAEAEQVFTTEALMAAQQVMRRMPVGEAVVEAILDIVRACRPEAPEAPARVRKAWPGGRARAPRRR
jgi:MoxR-like ATPase